MYSGGKEARSALDDTCKLTVDDIYKAARFLKTQNAPKIDGSYVAIIHPDVAYDFMRDDEWIDVHKYSATTEIFEGEIGKLGGVRFVETTNVATSTTGASGATLHACMIIGKDAYGVVDIEGGATPKMIIKDFGSAGSADPLDQRATAGYKLFFTAARLQELAMVRIECGATA
jgi:N4-gp56 family major capsid protein